MSQGGSNADKKSTGHAIPVAAMGVRAIVAALIASGAVWLSHAGGSGTILAAVTTSSQRIASPTPTPSSTGSTLISGIPAVCASGSLLLVGSTAFASIAQQVAAAYQQGCGPHFNITIDVNRVKDQAAADAYNRVCPALEITVNGVMEADSAYGIMRVKEAVAHNCQDAGSIIAMYDTNYTGTTYGLTQYSMGVLIFSVVAHRDLFHDSNISLGELYKIFVLLGEPDKIAVGRREGSGSRKAFFAMFPNVNQIPSQYAKNCPPPTGFTSCTEDNTSDLLDFVNKTQNAIGYAEINEPSSSDPDVAQLTIDYFMPTAENVNSGHYPFWAVEHLYASMQQQQSMLAKAFLDFLPRYLVAYPPHDYAACSDSARLKAACNPVIQSSPSPKPSESTIRTSPSPEPSKSTLRAVPTGRKFSKLVIGVLGTLGILLILLIFIYADRSGRRRRRVTR